MWVETSENSLFTYGTKRMTLKPPFGVVPVPPAKGYTFSVPFVDTTYTIGDYDYDEAKGEMHVVLIVSQSSKMSVKSNDMIVNVNPVNNVQPTPDRRLVSGYVKSIVPVDVTPQNPQAFVIAIPYIIGAIAVIVGLGAVYLVLTKVEDLVETPAVSLPLIAVAVLILWTVYESFSGKLKGAPA